MKLPFTTFLLFTTLWAQSQIFSVGTDPLSVLSHVHGNFTNGGEMDVFTTLTDEESLLTTLHSDALGNLIHQQDLLMNGQFAEVLDIVTFDDGSYILLLERYDNYYINYSLNVMKFSSSHTILWNKKLDIQDLYAPYFKHMIIDNGNGGVYISCSPNEYLGVINIDTNGNILWSKKYTGINSYGKSPGFSICRNGDGGVIGTLKEDSYQCVVNIDGNGQPIWAKTFFDQGYRWPVAIKPLNDGNFLIAGDFYGFDGTAYTYLQKISPTGDVLFAKKINSELQCHDMAVNDNDEIYILGSDWGGANTSVLKLDANCNIISTKSTDKLDLINSQYPHSFTSSSPTSFTARTMSSYKPAVIDLNDDIESLCFSSSLEGLNTTNDQSMQQANVTTGVLVDDLAVISTNQYYTSVSEQLFMEKDDACSILSISTATEITDISIFPNPASAVVTIDLMENNVQSVDIIDMQGKKIFEVCRNCSGHIETNISTIKAGVYSVVFTSADNRWVKKLVIN